MVARLIEGFESSTAAADYAGKWTFASSPAIAPGSGRYGNGIRVSASATAQRTLDAQPTWVVGFALRVAGVPSATGAICSFLDGGITHCGIGLTDTSNQLIAWRGTVSTILGTAAAALGSGVWAYVEVKATIADAPSGSLVVRVNGAVVLNLTGIDTRNAGNASANSVKFLGVSGAPTDMDDIYLFDGTGTVNNDFAGDCRVQLVVPSGAGASTLWTPSAGANYACVDDAPPNADTDYVASATAGQTDTYQFGDLAVASGTVKAVQATAIARKDDAGSRTFALVARPGSTDRVGATQGVGDTYSAFTEVWNVNPDTAAPWTVAEVNASQFGQRLVS